MITYQTTKNIPLSKLLALYTDAKWSAYTNEPTVLENAVQSSLHVITAWKDNTLIGLIRAVGDGFTILYIQDLLVLEAFHNQGIGYELMNQLLENYPDVRQKVLMTEEAPNTRHFYEKCGFSSADKGHAVAFYYDRLS